jgi:folate-dependent phosphoribosylglycinamide formyltransferase PurN
MHSYFLEQGLPVRICFATASRTDVPVVKLCEDLGIPCHVINPRNMREYEAELLQLVQDGKIELIALAGFMKLLSADFLITAGIPVLNIHPALLPKYGGTGMYGMRVHEAVYASGDKVSGVTVHKVDPLYDHGEIVTQTEVDISACGSPEEIAAAVLKAEHQTYAPAIWKYLNRTSD